jgi:hypothetical protein
VTLLAYRLWEWLFFWLWFHSGLRQRGWLCRAHYRAEARLRREECGR